MSTYGTPFYLTVIEFKRFILKLFNNVHPTILLAPMEKCNGQCSQWSVFIFRSSNDFLASSTHTDFKEVKVDWSYVERLIPPKIIPEMPKDSEITPSGWRPPRGILITN